MFVFATAFAVFVFAVVGTICALLELLAVHPTVSIMQRTSRASNVFIHFISVGSISFQTRYSLAITRDLPKQAQVAAVVVP